MTQEENAKETTIPATNTDAGHEKEHHHTWMEEIVDEIKAHINTDFPLSGGETEKDFESNDQEEENIVKKEHLNDNFPLSGGIGGVV